jgi:hypothetical protein
MEKVTLSALAADVIESNRRGGRSDEEIIKIHAENPLGWMSHALHSLPLDTLIRALYIGYEVEMTREERVYEYYWSLRNSGYDDAHNAVHKTLNLLGTKIKGVND